LVKLSASKFSRRTRRDPQRRKRGEKGERGKEGRKGKVESLRVRRTEAAKASLQKESPKENLAVAEKERPVVPLIRNKFVYPEKKKHLKKLKPSFVNIKISHLHTGIIKTYS
jgi:hypothetical protein